MVSRSYVAHGGHARLQSLPRSLARFDQSYGGRFFDDRVDDIGLSAKAEMYVTVDQAR
jgi:hypothetical protein